MTKYTPPAPPPPLIGEVATLKDGKWDEVRKEVAFHYGGGYSRQLIVCTRFDGYGNSITRYIVTNYKVETEYEKYNSAVGAYNLIKPRRNEG